MEQRTQASIFEYSDYRQYLADHFASRKARNPSFSHRIFAKQAGLSSPSHLLMIIKGDRNLSHKTMSKISEGLKLGAKEQKYFELMVLYNQSTDLQAKARYFSEILSVKGTLKGLHGLEREKFDFLSKWFVVAIYVMVDLKDFRPDPGWIAKKLGGAITSAQAKYALESLQKLGMVAPDPVRGLRQVSGAVTVPDDTRSIAVFNYHHSMIRLASEALRINHVSAREMNGATIAIPAERLPEIKEKIRAFRKEINQLASSFEEPDQIYQLNIQLFPLSVLEEK